MPTWKTTTKPEEMGRGGKMPEPGKYQCVVKTVDDSHTKYPKTIPVEFEIVGGTVPGQEKKTFTEHLYFDPNDPADFAIERISRFLWACGLMNAGQEYDGPVRGAAGRQLVVEIYEDEYEENGKKKRSAKVSWRDGGVWPIGHADVSDVPVNAQAVAATQSAPTNSAAASTAQAATPAGEPADPFAGL